MKKQLFFNIMVKSNMPFVTTSIIAHIDLPGGYRLLRIVAGDWVQHVQAGDVFVIQNDMLPYLRHSIAEHKVDVLLKVNEKNHALITGQPLEIIAIEHAMDVHAIEEKKLRSPTDNGTAIIATPDMLGVGLSLALADIYPRQNTLFLFELTAAAPFRLQPSRLYIPYLPAEMTANFSMLEEKQVAARVISQQGLPGCFDGTMEELVSRITRMDVHH